MKEYFKSITEAGLIKLINSTKKNLFLCLPAIHKDVADAIDKLDKLNTFMGNKEVDIHILVDFDSQTFRQGYGNIGVVRGLINGDSEVKSLTDNRISFIITDDSGYYLFIESRSLIPADKETINAIKIDPVSIVRLKKFFFNDSIQIDFKDELTNAIIDESVQLKDADSILQVHTAQTEEITDEIVKTVSDDLDRNPPLKPDFKRIVEFYSNKFQYAELHFEGQNFKHFSINIPSKLLPYKNKELRKKLITKLKLFENITENKDLKPFEDIIAEKKKISKEYITNIKCRRGKGIIKRTNKISFQKEVGDLSKRLKDVKSKMYHSMQNEIEMAKKGLIKTLSSFLVENPLEEMESMRREDFPLIAKNISTNLVNSKVNIPDPTKWINGFQIETNFSDITFEDLKDKTLLDELYKNGIIKNEDSKHLAIFGRGVSLTVD
jgi:hypothetical protein